LTTRIRNSKGESILVSVSVSHLPEAGNDLLYVIRDLRSESTPVGAGRSPQDLSCLDEPELVEAIERAGSPLEIKSARNRLAGVITRGHAQGLHGSLLTRQITDVSDAAIRNCCERALKELGPAPVRFAFLAFGSEGRREASLITDQDNGLIYADPEPDQADGVSAYFELFSNKVCEALMEAGFVKCHGDLMASNPEWRMPSAQWCAAMGKWSAAGTPEALKGINVMADHRCTFGDETLCGDLRKALQAAARGSQVFYFNLAKAALVYRPPSEAFARWSPGGGTATLNIKEAITPIVNLARIYALRNGLSVISTPARLEALAGQGGLPAHEVPSLIGGFEFLLRLRLQRHLEIAAGDEKVDDLIQLARLSELDHATLRHVLELTDRMQNHLRMDFCAMQV
jgi:CBS domain-containing protein